MKTFILFGLFLTLLGLFQPRLEATPAHLSRKAAVGAAKEYLEGVGLSPLLLDDIVALQRQGVNVWVIEMRVTGTNVPNPVIVRGIISALKVLGYEPIVKTNGRVLD
jgi:hypothetical protein